MLVGERQRGKDHLSKAKLVVRTDQAVTNTRLQASTVVARIDECYEQRCSSDGPNENSLSPQQRIAAIGLRGGCRPCLPAHRPALGYLTSFNHRTRYLLDAGSHPHSAWGNCARAAV